MNSCQCETESHTNIYKKWEVVKEYLHPEMTLLDLMCPKCKEIRTLLYGQYSDVPLPDISGVPWNLSYFDGTSCCLEGMPFAPTERATLSYVCTYIYSGNALHLGRITYRGSSLSTLLNLTFKNKFGILTSLESNCILKYIGTWTNECEELLKSYPEYILNEASYDLTQTDIMLGLLGFKKEILKFKVARPVGLEQWMDETICANNKLGQSRALEAYRYYASRTTDKQSQSTIKKIYGI